ncbi:hypothetical protein B0I35DRAFT_190270 [Stachybotrys elegans]|uniref:Uncharacterized protein n=1 Tax=Stachybotrys elegans TaxID=80388 RepID=A0A8K0SS03_9HYPO|nr:hypothetical protein B0I35DRAFT_190270 [Stachybotrys elegans]
MSSDSDSEPRDRARGWGANTKDFDVRQRKRPAASARSSKRKRKVRTIPSLAIDLDEFECYTQALAADEETVFPELVGSPDLGEDLLEDETPDDMPDDWLAMNTKTLDELIARMEDTCGPAPDMESIPESHLDSIQRHHEWYLSLLDSLFDAAQSVLAGTARDEPFTKHMLRWLKVNSSERMRNALSEFFLHPLVRSFRTRAALGQGKTERIFDILESLPLSEGGDGIPNILGIYLVHGHHADSTEDDLAYVGQCGSMKPDWNGALGARLRAKQHHNDILRCRNALPVEATTRDAARSAVKGTLWVHQRLANPDISAIGFSLLSVFPFPHSALGRENIHFRFLLSVAETLDVLLMTSLRSKDNLPINEGYRLLSGRTLRPSHLPRWKLEGLNRVLPSNQPVTIGSPLWSMCWSPDKISTFMDLVREHKSEVHGFTLGYRVC